MTPGDFRTSVQKFVRFAAGGMMALALVSCGGGGGSAGTTSGTSGSSSTPASVSLLFSSSELPSSGTTGTEVTVTALVKNANNNAIASAPVTFTASSGALTAVSATTDANGKATALLSTSGDRTNRTITVTAKAGGVTTTGTVSVVGTAVSITGPSTVTSGGTGDFAITVRDQAGKAISGVPVAISSTKGNSVALKTAAGGTTSAAITNTQGQVVVTVTGVQAGKDTLVASSQGNTFSYEFNVNTLSLVITPATSQANVGTCNALNARLENSGVGQNGSLNMSTSRGVIYTDTACTTPLGSSAVPVTSGQAQTTYIKSDTAGTATITGTVANGPTAQTYIKFVAPLTPSATISLQPEPSVVSPSGTGQSNTSVLTVVVRDGTANNNLVKGAVVEFSILTDQSGGTLSNPAVVTTEDDGTARVIFSAGPATTPANGVQIQARIQGTSKTDTTYLTVSRKSLFVTAGTGNKLETPSSSTYRQDYTVFVTDASGNAVPEVTVTASVKPTYYLKGIYKQADAPATGWIIAPSDAACPNEDRNYNGILDPGEDTNGSLALEPRIPMTITSSGKTDANGTSVISILYPRDRANWTIVKMIVTASVQGTEATYTTTEYTLPVLAADVADKTTAPPGNPSPYGVNTCDKAN